MLRLAVSTFVLSASLASAANVDPNPASLQPTKEQIAKAEKLVADLGSDAFTVRENASRELAEMGRLALKAVDKALTESGSAEVRSRCESLRPAMAEEDLTARLAAFRADTDGKFDHSLPGWEKFQKSAGKTAGTRDIFSKMMENETTVKLIAALNGPVSELHQMVLTRRYELYSRQTGRERQIVNGRIVYINTNNPPSAAEVAGLLFVENSTEPLSDRRTTSYVQMLLTQGAMKETVTDAEKGLVLRKLLVDWCDKRVDVSEQSVAMNLANLLELKELPASKFALKVLNGGGINNYQKAQAMCVLAKSGGKDQIPNLEKHFDNKTVFYSTTVVVNNVQKKVEIQLRDVALAMCVLASDESIADYELLSTYGNSKNINLNVKYSYYYYHFTDDEKREAGFKKWAERKKK